MLLFLLLEVSFFLLFLYTYANFLIKNGQVEGEIRVRSDRKGKEERKGKEQCSLRSHSIRKERIDRTRRGTERSDSTYSLLTAWVSEANLFLSSF